MRYHNTHQPPNIYNEIKMCPSPLVITLETAVRRCNGKAQCGFKPKGLAAPDSENTLTTVLHRLVWAPSLVGLDLFKPNESSLAYPSTWVRAK